ncbi:MAG: thioredoxin [Candidatus Krumholzibacteriales bacterium]
MSDKVKHVGNDDFKTEVLESDLPVLVDFWAPWCGPCKMVEPIVEDLAGEYDGKFKFVKVNTDDARDVAVQYGIMSIPTLKIFKGGEVVDSAVGAAPRDMLKDLIEKHL